MIQLVIVRLTLLRIGQDLVRLVDLLEFRRRVRIVRVQVGMVHLDHFAVRRLDVIIRRLPVYAEDLIIVFLCHNTPAFFCKSARIVPKNRLRMRIFAAKRRFLLLSLMHSNAVKNHGIPVRIQINY